VVAADQVPDALVVRLASRGQPQRSLRTVQQPGPDRILQVADRLAHRTLSQVGILGSFGKAPSIRDTAKQFKRSKLQKVTPVLNRLIVCWHIVSYAYAEASRHGRRGQGSGTLGGGSLPCFALREHLPPLEEL